MLHENTVIVKDTWAPRKRGGAHELGTHCITNCFKLVDMPRSGSGAKLLRLRNNPRTLLNRLAGRNQSAPIRSLL